MKITYRYESTQRPVSIGTYPKRGAVDLWNYKGGKQKTYASKFNEIGDGELHVVESWGYIEYNRKLTEKEMADYELAYYGEMIEHDLPI